MKLLLIIALLALVSLQKKSVSVCFFI